MTTPTVALITARQMPDPWNDYELPWIEDALRAEGISFETTGWHDNVDWSRYSLTVLRSAWDLYWHVDDFKAWLHAAGSATTVLNPPETVAWNLDKRYLRELAAHDVAVVPTTFVEPGEPVPNVDYDEFVVKPTTSAGARNSARYRRGDDVRANIAAIHDEGSAAMIQPYLRDVETEGEHALVYYNGTFDHAIRKGHVMERDEPYTTMRDSHPSPVTYEPTDAERKLAASAIAATPRGNDLLYARIDMVPTPAGPVLMELEYVDPVLFFSHSEGSAARYATAVAERLHRLVPV